MNMYGGSAQQQCSVRMSDLLYDTEQVENV